jgi:hypothetical protein
MREQRAESSEQRRESQSQSQLQLPPFSACLLSAAAVSSLLVAGTTGYWTACCLSAVSCQKSEAGAPAGGGYIASRKVQDTKQVASRLGARRWRLAAGLAGPQRPRAPSGGTAPAARLPGRV